MSQWEPGKHGAEARVEAWMAKEVVSAQADTPLSALVDTFHRHHIRHIPIVGAAGQLRGLVSNRDMLRATPRSPTTGQTQLASHIMTRDLVTISPDATVHEAGQLLLQHKLGCLPVVSPDGRLVGILSESDFIRMVLASPLAPPEGADAPM